MVVAIPTGRAPALAHPVPTVSRGVVARGAKWRRHDLVLSVWADSERQALAIGTVQRISSQLHQSASSGASRIGWLVLCLSTVSQGFTYAWLCCNPLLLFVSVPSSNFLLRFVIIVWTPWDFGGATSVCYVRGAVCIGSRRFCFLIAVRANSQQRAVGVLLLAARSSYIFSQTALGT